MARRPLAGHSWRRKALRWIAVRLLLTLFAAGIGGGTWEMRVEYARSLEHGVAVEVSVYDASSWVALKAPWRQPCARDGGPEDFGLSGCEPDGSERNRGVRALKGRRLGVQTRDQRHAETIEE